MPELRESFALGVARDFLQVVEHDAEPYCRDQPRHGAAGSPPPLVLAEEPNREPRQPHREHGRYDSSGLVSRCVGVEPLESVQLQVDEREEGLVWSRRGGQPLEHLDVVLDARPERTRASGEAGDRDDGGYSGGGDAGSGLPVEVHAPRLSGVRCG
jgi:hypothetical protein